MAATRNQANCVTSTSTIQPHLFISTRRTSICQLVCTHRLSNSIGSASRKMLPSHCNAEFPELRCPEKDLDVSGYAESPSGTSRYFLKRRANPAPGTCSIFKSRVPRESTMLLCPRVSEKRGGPCCAIGPSDASSRLADTLKVRTLAIIVG
jgi:hypothetical protein